MHLTVSIIAILGLCLTPALSEPDIIYKQLNTYDLVWQDKGSGAHMNVGIWRPANNENDYYLLGDVATNSGNTPQKVVSLAVKMNGNNALAVPTSATQIWADHGSGADWNVAIYKLNAPDGYTCIGDVAVRSYESDPDLTKYCCVKDEYLVTATANILIWNDKGSHSKHDVSIRQVSHSEDPFGIEGRNFIAYPYYDTPKNDRNVRLLKDDGITVKSVWSMNNVQRKPLHVYEIKHESAFQEIWNDHGSDGDHDVSIWKVSESKDNFYSLSDYADGDYNRPTTGYLVKAMESYALSAPTQFNVMYTDKGTGANENLKIWQPSCPPGYRALGDIATNGEDPSHDSMRCVYHNLTLAGQWSWIWDDKGTGGDTDGAIYRITGANGGQAVNAMAGVASHTEKPSIQPLILEPSMINYFSEQPIIKMIVKDVKYDVPSDELSGNGKTVATTTIINRASTPQQTTRQITIETSKTEHWTFDTGIEIGISSEFDAGVPLVEEEKITISATTHFNYETGSENTITQTDSISAQATVPPQSKMNVYVRGTQYKVDVPYEATVVKTYLDGSESTARMNGVYKGMEVSNFVVDYSEAEALDDDDAEEDATEELSLFNEISKTSDMSNQPDIIYKQLSTYDLIWNDKGSGADENVAIWRPANNENDYYLLGDVATTSYSSAGVVSLAVKMNGNNSLTVPTSATQIWADHGSGADWNVAIYKLNAPDGYTCIGDVAVRSYTDKPELNKYRCVKDDYLVPATASLLIWNDKGSHSDKDISIRQVSRSADPYGIMGRNFIGYPYYTTPGNERSVKLLKDDGTTVKNAWSINMDEHKPLHVYEVKYESAFQEIWNDHGSHGDHDVSLWKVKESQDDFHSLSDYAVDNYNRPTTGYLVKAMKDNVLSAPTQFNLVYTDKGTGAHKNLKIWQPSCPSGYRALGDIATNGEDPSHDSMRCVYNNLTLPGQWSWIWDDKGTGGDTDGAIYRITGTNGTHGGQAVNAMAGVASHTEKPSIEPLVFKSSMINYFSEQPIIKMIVKDVKYNVPSDDVIGNGKTVATTEVINRASLPQKATRQIIVETSKTDHWTFESGIETGVSSEFDAGIPFVMETKITISESTHFDYETGSESTTTQSDSVSAQVEVPPNSKITVYVKGEQYNIDVPYEATVVKTYLDGTESTAQITGVYKGVEVTNFVVEYGEAESLDDDDDAEDSNTVSFAMKEYPTTVTSEMSNWKQISNPANADVMAHIASGKFGTWAISDDDTVYYMDDEENWVKTSHKLRQLSVGGNRVVGVNKYGSISMITEKSDTPSWKRISGFLEQISISDHNNIWGVNHRGVVYRYIGENKWSQVYGSLKQVSVGHSGVWGVDKDNLIYYRTGTFGDVDSNGSGWQRVGGSLVSISSGDGYVVGVNSFGEIWKRNVTSQNPTLGKWMKVPGKLSQVDAGVNAMWGIQHHGTIWTKLQERDEGESKSERAIGITGHTSVLSPRLKCWKCDNARSNLDCMMGGELVMCPGDHACMNEVIHQYGMMTMNKGCQRRTECDSKSGKNEKYWQMHCELKTLMPPSIACQCCCLSDHCNDAPLWCRKQPQL